MRKSCSEYRRDLAKDVLFVLIGAVVAYAFSMSGYLDILLGFIGSASISSFVAGLFYTSAFTIAPASVAISHISGAADPFWLAFWGAIGAACGDLILFLFIRDKFADDLVRSVRPSLVKHLLSSLHFGFLKWLSPILGIFVIASPLPDEIGLAMLGLSKFKVVSLIPVAFLANFVSIYGLVWLTRAL